MKRITAFFLSFAIAVSLIGCANRNSGIPQNDPTIRTDQNNQTDPHQQENPTPDRELGHTTNLMANITARDIDVQPNQTDGLQAVTDFSVRLAQNSFADGTNLLVSPLSILCALAMTANGAAGETRAQMEATFGMSIEELNHYLAWYVSTLPQGEQYKLHLANSIWFTEDSRFSPKHDFLQVNADYYGADIYRAPFDTSTLQDINQWVEEKTDGMIPKILNAIPPNAIMYLINALSFEAQWSTVYQEHNVYHDIFTKEDGTEQQVELMYALESHYLSDERTTGFIKYYRGQSYAFVALLPKEGISIEEYLRTLTGEQLRALLDNVQQTPVKTAIPKFETEYSVELSEVLTNMGMTDAFLPQSADFSAMGTSTDGNIYINRVLHKTFISVGEQGTKAGAVTLVEPTDTAVIEPDKQQEVFLNRPFVYLLIDCENGLPFFIGAMMDMEA